MAQAPWPRPEVVELRRRAGEERRRARRAGELAMEYDARAAACPDRLRAVYLRGAQVHRRMQERQLAAAKLHDIYADRLEQQAGQPWPAPPPFMAAVAQTLGVSGATAALFSQHTRLPVLVATSDPTAEAAYNLEASFAEGPVVMTAIEGKPMQASGAQQLSARWRWYGPAVHSLGIGSVTAVPLQLPAFRLGALCCYGGASSPGQDVGAVDVIARALAPILLRTAPGKSLLELTDAPGLRSG